MVEMHRVTVDTERRTESGTLLWTETDEFIAPDGWTQQHIHRCLLDKGFTRPDREVAVTRMMDSGQDGV